MKEGEKEREGVVSFPQRWRWRSEWRSVAADWESGGGSNHTPTTHTPKSVTCPRNAMDVLSCVRLVWVVYSVCLVNVPKQALWCSRLHCYVCLGLDMLLQRSYRGNWHCINFGLTILGILFTEYDHVRVPVSRQTKNNIMAPHRSGYIPEINHQYPPQQTPG